MAEKIAVEERKLLIAQRKLESIRLLDELLDRVKVRIIDAVVTPTLLLLVSSTALPLPTSPIFCVQVMCGDQRTVDQKPKCLTHVRRPLARMSSLPAWRSHCYSSLLLIKGHWPMFI